MHINVMYLKCDISLLHWQRLCGTNKRCSQHRIQRPGKGEGAKNMKSMWLPLAAIFFMTYLYRVGGHGPLGAPLDLLLVPLSNLSYTVVTRMHSSRMRTVRCSGRLSWGVGGCLARGGLPGGVCLGGGVCPGWYVWSGWCTPPPLWTEWQTLVKT